MTKTLETKRKILQLLKKKEMTISELSSELNLSTATVSQHITELQSSGAIEKINNEHFKKLKYYKATETASPVVARYVKYVIGVVILLALVSGIYFYQSGRNSALQPNTVKTANTTIASTTINNTSGNTSIPGGGGTFACPMLFYTINGSIVRYSNLSVYYLNSSNGQVADYVIDNGSSGNLYVSEFVNHVLIEQANPGVPIREHYTFLTQINKASNGSSPGLNISISPQNFTVVNNETLNSTVNLRTNNTAEAMTYWLRIDGPCGPGVAPVLVTVGNKPYNGTVTQDTGDLIP